jgi:hypothetical protein
MPKPYRAPEVAKARGMFCRTVPHGSALFTFWFG